MAIILGDVHGDVERVKRFLDFRKEDLHICTGDFCDDFKNTVTEQKWCLERMVDSDCVMLWGNHDCSYLVKSAKTMCSGWSKEGDRAFSKYLNNYTGRFVSAYAVDDFIVTHGGVVDNIIPPIFVNNVDDLAFHINEEFSRSIYTGLNSNIWNISPARGGCDLFSGVFWADFECDYLSRSFNQIVGHTERSGGKSTTNGETIQICVDTRDFRCYDTVDRKFVDF